jgi:putative intracellular protease/amidase
MNKINNNNKPSDKDKKSKKMKNLVETIGNVYVFLFDGFSDWEVAYFMPELKKSEKINLKTFTIDCASITSMGGLKISPDFSLAEVEMGESSLLVLPGGTAWEKGEITGIDNLVKTFYENNNAIAAICAATTYLGEKGYLDGIKHTSNDLNYLKALAPNYKGENNYQSELAVTDKNIITACGIASLEFAREIFRKVNLYDENHIEKWYQLFKNGIWMY